MFLRKMTAALCPLLLCAAVCALFRRMDSLFSSGSFAAFLLKGTVLGMALALTLPAAGIKAHTNGLTGWMWLGIGLIAAVLLLQYLSGTGILRSEFLSTLFPVNGQVLMAESTVLGYMMLTALIYRHK